MGRARRPAIVVGYDGSPASRCAAAMAARRAGPTGIVCIVSAYQPGDGREHELEREHAQALLNAVLLVGDEELLDTEYETELVSGAPAAAIDRVARDRDADEIVIGARGVGRVQALLGSVSHELLHLADRPVLVVTDAAAENASRWCAGSDAVTVAPPRCGQ